MESCIMTLAAALTVTTTAVSALQCYQCTITPPAGYYNETKRLCVHFDYSDKYIVECPYSTMCMKQDFHLDIQNGVRIDGVLRDCAQQKHEFQEFKQGTWRQKTEILEPYEEGCQQIDDKGARTPATRYCYCRGDLCNSSPSTNKDAYHTDAMAVILVFNLLKYIRSLR